MNRLARLVRVSVLALAYGISAGGCGGGGSDGGGGSAPDVPTGLSARSDASGEVTLDWNAVPGATSYNLYWATSAGVTKQTGTGILDVSRPHTHTGLSNGTSHFYIVTAVAGAAESMESTEASAMPLDAPAGSSASAGSGEVS